MASLISILSFLFFLFNLAAAAPNNRHITSFSIANSPWRPSDNRTLLSPKNHTFAAGFRRSPSNPSLYIFAVWVQASADKTTVWSLNPNRPIPSSTPLTISPNGSITLLDPSGRNLFPPSASGDAKSAILTLGDDGNLASGKWNSFGSPTDTILPNQPIPSNGTTLTSGRYKFVNGTDLVFNGTDKYWTAQNQLVNLTSDGNLQCNGGNNLIMADVNQITVRRLTLDPMGNLRVYSLNKMSGDWRVVWQAILELCTILGTCGINEICKPVGNTTACVCPPGYRNSSDGSGCKRKASYLSTSKFFRLDYVSFNGEEDNTLTPRNFDICQSNCLANKSCVAFRYQFNGQRTCINHFYSLSNGYWSPATEISTYLRVTNSESDVNNFTGMASMINTTCPIKISLPQPPKESKTTARNLAIIGTLFALELLAGILSFWAFLRKYSKYRDMARTFGLEFLPAGGPKRFSYAELKAATKDFSDVVGRGGFGVVYKGELPDGRIIAVKRLKNGAGGGEAEFWAEVTIIARMHHLNLVRMWGFCAEKEQRMLVYEYIPNGSLDKFLFQQEVAGNEAQQSRENEGLLRQTPTLDWNIRYRIALGVARAIAYLHEECLEWVLHCDIKPENILLEDDFCPKVSDFGLSKLTNKKDIVTMSRIRGTRGYLAPEWVTHREPITAKADVYSFGVVLLEIVTGTRSSKFQRASMESEDWYFPRWAYEKVYVERRVEDMLDPVILASYDDQAHLPMVERMVKTAMWCLQDRAETRPSMGKVAKMLEGSVEITEPEKPSIFYLGEE